MFRLRQSNAILEKMNLQEMKWNFLLLKQIFLNILFSKKEDLTNNFSPSFIKLNLKTSLSSFKFLIPKII